MAITSCQKDDEIGNTLIEQNHSSFKVTEIAEAKIQENQYLYSKLTDIKEKITKHKNGIQNKEVTSSEYNFIIDTNSAKYIESNDGLYHSYTFMIKRSEKTGSLENLLLSLQPDGSYQALIITYAITQQEKENLANNIGVDLTGKTSTNVIDGQELIPNILNKIILDGCIGVECTPCDNGYDDSHDPRNTGDGETCSGSGILLDFSDCGLAGEPGGGGQLQTILMVNQTILLIIPGLVTQIL